MERRFEVSRPRVITGAPGRPAASRPPPPGSCRSTFQWCNYFTNHLSVAMSAGVSPISLLADAAGAGIGLWRGRPREWRQGGEGYARRFGSSYAQHVAYLTILSGASSLLHEDNRYVLSGQSGFSRRLEYAVGSVVLARHNDPGGRSHRRLSVSRIGAFAGAALVSRMWQPRSANSLRSGTLNVGASIGIAVGFDVAREFLPCWLHIK